VSHLTAAFADELIKVGGAGSWLAGKALGVGKLIAKHPGKALGVGLIAIPTLMAARAGYASGLQGGEEGRQLAAGPDETGRIRPSDAAYTNYHELFKHKASPKAVEALSKNYKPEAFQNVSSASKGK